MAQTSEPEQHVWMKRAFKSRDPALWNQLYKTYIRPQLEFAVQVWNPYYVGNVNMMKRVHRSK